MKPEDLTITEVQHNAQFTCAHLLLHDKQQNLCVIDMPM